jgi:hypothetical protein
LLFVIGYVWHRLKQDQRASIIASPVRTYLLLSVLASLCMLVIFMVTWINDPLGARFILFLPLTLFCSAACLLATSSTACQSSHGAGRTSARLLLNLFSGIYPAAILTCVTAVAAIRMAYWTTHVDPVAREFRIAEWRPGERYPDGAYADFTIDPQITSGPPVVRENRLVVPPPCYRWIELRMQERR